MSRSGSFLRVALAYLVAIGVAAAWLVWGPGTGHLWSDALVADVIATLAVFGFSRYYGNSSFYDAYWSVIPPLLLAYWWMESPVEVDTTRAVLLTVVVWFWALRLTANWVRGFPGLHHEDWRYPMLREAAGRWELVVDLFAIHLVPTMQVFLGCLPAYVVLTRAGEDVGWLDAVAVAVGIGAVLLEWIADEQMRVFIRQRVPGAVMDRGLWSISRHPNYLGEITFWLSLALFGIAAAPAEGWWLLVGVVAMTAMFLGASIPMMERRSLERRPAYAEVTERVPMLLPGLKPPQRAKRRT